MALQVKDQTVYILTSGGVVVSPYVQYYTVAECDQHTLAEAEAGNIPVGDFQQWVQTVVSIVFENGE